MGKYSDLNFKQDCLIKPMLSMKRALTETILGISPHVIIAA